MMMRTKKKPERKKKLLPSNSLKIHKSIIQLPFSSREGCNINYIVIHCCAYPLEAAVDSFKQCDVSAHYIISQKGEIVQLVPDEMCAWHAGRSFWNGVSALNKQSIGIELSSPSLGQKTYPHEQIESLVFLLKKLKKKYNIKPSNIIGHSDVAPQRKPDPGKDFPWKTLAQNGLGVWFDTKNAAKIADNDLKTILQTIGYETENIDAALSAFCRHFYPSRISLQKNIFTLLDNPFERKIYVDKRLMNRAKAVCYAYLQASKNPCKI